MLRLAEAGVDPFDDEAIAVASQAGGAASGAARAVQQWREYGMDGADVQSAMRGAALSLAYHLDGSRDPSAIIGDDPTDLHERGYGNPQINGENAYHGTHVAGIIGALRDGQGAEGICPWVRLMPIVAVPDGDERDKDVANAIRYAVDNGARIICCSFGKGWSPDQSVVDAAARYAEAKGVLIVHAAGNEGTNLDVTPHYPIPWTHDDDGTRRHLTTWIEVGASGPEAGRELAAEFLNYGSESVDLFAPGVEIPSSVPGGGVGNASGTSMAAPTVAGVAALVWSQHPELSASELRERLLRTARRYPSVIVKRPGDGSLVQFSTLSHSGGIVDAWAALSEDQAGGNSLPDPDLDPKPAPEPGPEP
jgi:subtilisin family serine protease